MTDKLKQLDFRFVPVEDRLMMRLNTTGGTGLRFWVTRRYAALLWQALMAGAEGGQTVKSQDSEVARKAVMEIQEQAAIQKSDFRTRYEEDGLTYPMGEDPVLLVALSYRLDEADRLILVLKTVDEKSVTITLDANLIHACRKLLADTTDKAEWEMGLAVGPEAAVSVEPEATRH